MSKRVESFNELECLHCGARFLRSELRIVDGMEWCPTEGCDGGGVGVDLWPVRADACEGRRGNEGLGGGDSDGTCDGGASSAALDG